MHDDIIDEIRLWIRDAEKEMKCVSRMVEKIDGDIASLRWDCMKWKGKIEDKQSEDMFKVNEFINRCDATKLGLVIADQNVQYKQYQQYLLKVEERMKKLEDIIAAKPDPEGKS